MKRLYRSDCASVISDGPIQKKKCVCYYEKKNGLAMLNRSFY